MQTLSQRLRRELPGDEDTIFSEGETRATESRPVRALHFVNVSAILGQHGSFLQQSKPQDGKPAITGRNGSTTSCSANSKIHNGRGTAPCAAQGCLGGECGGPFRPAFHLQGKEQHCSLPRFQRSIWRGLAASSTSNVTEGTREPISGPRGIKSSCSVDVCSSEWGAPRRSNDEWIIISVDAAKRLERCHTIHVATPSSFSPSDALWSTITFFALREQTAMPRLKEHQTALRSMQGASYFCHHYIFSFPLKCVPGLRLKTNLQSGVCFEVQHTFLYNKPPINMPFYVYKCM